MKTLRQSLGDDPNNPSYIEGVRGEGYRLLPEVSSQAAATPPEPSPTRGTWPVRPVVVGTAVVIVLAALLAWQRMDKPNASLDDAANGPISTLSTDAPATARMVQPTIAVLPFSNLSQDANNQFFADGIHDDLLTRISSIKDIKTISRTSVMTYRGSNMRVGEIAGELGVSTILEGGVQRSGDQVRINLQLIDAETDAHIWAQTYTRELTANNVFSVQGEIVEAVAGALQAILSDDERRQLEKLPTSNLQALDAYFLGNQYFNLNTSSGFDQAITAYQAAIELDPDFALAYSKQAMALLEQVFSSGLPSQTQLEKSRPLIDQAILLDPGSSEAFTALGNWYRRSGDIERAEQAFKQATTLGPNNVSALVSYASLLQWDLSDPESAVELFSKAVDLDPQNADLRRQLALALPMVGRATEDVIRMMEDIVASHPDFALNYRDLANMYSDWEFRHDKGIRTLRKAFELDPMHPPIAFWNAIMHWRLADYENTAHWMNYIAGLVPNSEEALVYKGWASVAEENIEAARDNFLNSDSDSPLYWLGIFYLGNVDYEEGRFQQALERYMAYSSRFDGTHSNVNCYFGISAVKAFQALGDQETAQGLLDQLLGSFENGPPRSYHDSAIHHASLLALSGRQEAAIEVLEEWVNRGGATALLQQELRNGLDSIKDDPRYQSILQSVESRLGEQRANLARWEASGEMSPMPEVVYPRQAVSGQSD